MLKYARVKDSRRSRTSRDGGSVPRVSPITAHGASTSSAGGSAPLDFQSTDGLSDSAKNSLAKAFESASLDPQKLHHRSAQLRQLLHEARESIAANLKVPAENLEFVGELGFAYWAAISGALKNFSGSFIHGVTDRQVVHAFGREFAQAGNRTITLTTDKSGNLPYESALHDSISAKQPVVVFWQAANRETGVVQKEIGISLPKNSMLVADMTAALAQVSDQMIMALRSGIRESLAVQRAWQFLLLILIQIGAPPFRQLISVAYLAPTQNLYS